MGTGKNITLGGGFSLSGGGAVWIDYANEVLMLLNTFVTATATWFTPAIAATAIKQTRRAYSTKSWPCSRLISPWNFTYNFRDRSPIWSSPIGLDICKDKGQIFPFLALCHLSVTILYRLKPFRNG